METIADPATGVTIGVSAGRCSSVVSSLEQALAALADGDVNRADSLLRELLQTLRA